MPSRILALDYGIKRIGVAVSDELGWTARPLETYERRTLAQDLAHIRELVETQGVGRVVLGLPLRLGGEEGLAVQAVHEFLEHLAEAVPVPVDTWDERLTTKEAEELLISAKVGWKERKGLVDRLAAAVLLQSYLEAHAPPVAGPGPEGDAGGDVPGIDHPSDDHHHDRSRAAHRTRAGRRPRRRGRLSDDEVG